MSQLIVQIYKPFTNPITLLDQAQSPPHSFTSKSEQNKTTNYSHWNPRKKASSSCSWRNALWAPWATNIFAHGVTSMSLGGSLMSVNGTRSLTHSILINLFIEPGLNNFLLPPLLRIVFVQGCSIYDCGLASFTTTLSARSKNWYKTPGKSKLESVIVMSRQPPSQCLAFY